MVDPFQMSMGLFGGLALFLLGMNYLSDGLKNAAGDQMRVVLEKFTKNRVMAAITGAGVTAVVQSSSVTTVLVVGFVSAGVMKLSQSVGVIMGANVGSTMTAQIVAFSVEQYAPAMIAIGFLINFVAKKDRTRHVGSILMGLGLVFFGMGMMSQSMAPLRTYQPFIGLMQAMAQYPFLAILIAAFFTALVQSSSATTSIIVVMAGEGLVSLEAGIAMALGANIGTCATAALSAIGKPVEARRAAAVHVIFNVAGVAIWLPFVSLLAQLTISISPSYPELIGLEQLAAETPRQIANANTLFNIINTAVFLFFTEQIAKLAIRLVPEREPEIAETVSAEFLNDAILGTPSFALHAARQETARIGEFALEALELVQRAVLNDDTSALAAAADAVRRSDALYPQIVLYVSRLGHSEMREIDQIERQGIGIAASELDLLSDILQERLLPLVAEHGLGDSHPHLRKLFEIMQTAIEDTTIAVRDRDVDRAQAVIEAKGEMAQVFSALWPDPPASSEPTDEIARELEMVQVLRLMIMVARRAARTVLFDSAAMDREPPSVAV